jgi:hypothetical protein
MPTFACFTAPGKLTLAQNGEIANWCTNLYHEEFGNALGSQRNPNRWSP